MLSEKFSFVVFSNNKVGKGAYFPNYIFLDYPSPKSAVKKHPLVYSFSQKQLN